MRDGGRRVFLFVLLASLGAIAAALVSQHGFDMRPCPWCVLQRLLFAVLALIAAVGLLWRSAAAGRALALLGIVVAALGAAAAVWQHAVASSSGSCSRTLADRIISGSGLDALVPDVFAATASCAEARTQLLGLPYEYWSLALFALLALSLIARLAQRAQPAR